MSDLFGNFLRKVGNMDQPNCYTCKWRRPIPGNAHSWCAHPKTSAADELAIRGNQHGIQHGWFFWPIDFDPVWLENCTGYEEKQTTGAIVSTKLNMEHAWELLNQASRGMQIKYLPTHANGDVNHPDCEQGFITSVKVIDVAHTIVFARFWYKGHLPATIKDVASCLRTRGNSEGAELIDIVFLDKAECLPQDIIDYALKTYCEES
jgi:hypothetical protein